MYIAVDFDGTCVTHKFPMVGDDIGAVPALKALVKSGHKLILNTMRAHPSPKQNDPSLRDLGLTPTDKDTLQDAIDWFKSNNIPLFGVNDNPSQHSWTESTKTYAHLYIDDAALGCPLIKPYDGRPYVDWKAVMLSLVTEGVIDRDIYKEYYLSTLKEK